MVNPVDCTNNLLAIVVRTNTWWPMATDADTCIVIHGQSSLLPWYADLCNVLPW
ncbi:hypothetical protein DPMN_022547 [Dreissena polymorpha]|uniref:Uncharacterized protein n=1 Tax=Dreissena polymorpha TaxID=45954 RepID=A0A9D4SA78_DREPO|nr:hypothetical protein DPMN_022547 [Dreissena polymorpha]